MLNFAREFILSPRSTGAIVPSSRGLAETITRAAGVQRADTVVEFGSGTGVFTEQISKTISPNTLFFALEINPVFVCKTRERCPGVTVYQAGACATGDYLREHNRDSCDCIISGLPWTLFSDQEQDRILEVTASVLREGGRFVTFSYLGVGLKRNGRRFRRVLPMHFRQVETSRMVWRNLPPAYLYVCSK
ncbi:methyltransferase domain-containing protein [Granulosicoccaceae sp. 1_MG-2023]|nr:methyltransferase domain-containing protein [Granulosicoccaceae sp. 1_MG-2023]